jgi:DNA-directed RNA polymerase subunit RPC12/RpoP
MDISFNCDKCGQGIVIDEAGAGRLVDCPKCGQPLTVSSHAQLAVTAAMAIDRWKQPAEQQTRKTCPSCGSDAIIKATAAYEQGTSVIAGKSSQLGAMLIPGGGSLHVAPGVSSGGFGGVLQTELARRFAPPERPKRNWEGHIYFALGCVLALCGLPFFMNDYAWLGVVILVFGIISCLAGIARFQSLKQYAGAMQQYGAGLDVWRKFWYCKTCGEGFLVCDACEQTITIDEAGAGSIIKCPKCKTRVLFVA